ncbi:hypothetical protein [Pseudolysinimonas sp.]
MTADQKVTLEASFLNADVVASRLGLKSDVAERYVSSMRSGGYEAGVAQHRLADLLAEHLPALGVESLDRQLLTRRLTVGQLVDLEQGFFFKQQRRSGELIAVFMHAKLATDRETNVIAHIDPSRFVFSSTGNHLSGHKRLYVLGVVIAIEPKSVELRPVAIGWRGIGLSADERKLRMFNDRRDRHPSEIDQFAGIDWTSRISSAVMKKVADTPEAVVKAAVADLLAQDFVPMDWGGERSDMFTSNTRMGGRFVRSAWLLKGKSVKHPMRIADLGKNGDQLDRLFTEPAELYVVQSNQPIATDVRSMLDRCVHDYRSPSLGMVVDGDSTARILKLHGDI